MQRTVVLVDTNDTMLGELDIWQAHANPGVLHRAISVLLFNQNGELLLQKRSIKKPLWKEFWSNTVCTHPYVGESYLDCAVRRLDQEMGIILSPDQLQILYRFEYQADYNSELSEHELDTVIVGKYYGEVNPNPDEASDFMWVNLEELTSLTNNSKETITSNLTTINLENLTPWFKLILTDERFIEVTRNKLLATSK